MPIHPAPARRTRTARRTRPAALPSGLRAALLAGGLVLGLAACGGSDDDLVADPSAEGAAAAVGLMVEALRDGDPQAACAQLAAEAQRSFERTQGAPDCITAVDRAGEAASDLPEVDSDDIAVDGDRATARGGSADEIAAVLGLEQLTLSRVDERWAVG